jgi:Domain of unknown function (DUF1823)
MTDLPELNQATLWGIIRDEIEDTIANQLVWHCLGYRQDGDGVWQADLVAPEWRSDYPKPPDFIANRPPTVKLTRSIPPEHKQLLKEQLGFEGYKLNELIPRKTRRATITNWLLSYMKTHNLPL